ncbi:MAG TPA: Gfo/Idh/MocA family oxidoreductase [Bacteroidota bacterium]
MKSTKSAIIGTGFIGPAHLEALRRIGGVEVVALASLEGEKAARLAAQFGIPKVSANWKDIIADKDIEVIHNCTPNSLHFEINKAALLAGKHVVCEKPLTVNAKQSEELVQLARKARTVNAVVFNYRFYPLVQHAREMVLSGEVGTIHLVHGHYLQDWLFHPTDFNWRLSTKVGGQSRAFADIGLHWCDLIQFITNLKIRSVCADSMTVHKTRLRPNTSLDTFQEEQTKKTSKSEEIRIDTEDATSVLLRFENGAMGSLTVSQVSAGRKNWQWFEIDGSKKSLSWNQEDPNELWIGHRDKGNETIAKDPSLLNASGRRTAHYPGGHPEGYPDVLKNLFSEVYEFIRSGQDPRKSNVSFPTFAEGHRGTMLIEAILKSSKTKRWVNV